MKNKLRNFLSKVVSLCEAAVRKIKSWFHEKVPDVSTVEEAERYLGDLLASLGLSATFEPSGIDLCASEASAEGP